jgi:hypothetical protein
MIDELLGHEIALALLVVSTKEKRAGWGKLALI